MSDGPRIPLTEAQRLAAAVMDLLRPHCDRIEVAGSVRRQKPDVGDIEIVCIPEAQFNLLGEVYRATNKIEDAIYAAGYPLAKNGEKFKQFSIGPCNCDLFITTPEQYGVIFTIRTGSAEFSHRLVTPKNMGGLLPSFLQVKEGRLQDRASGVQLNTREEIDLFNAINLKWIEPNQR
jgi:DNA polymerase/3'-5' exonuclease PolX